MTTYFYTNYCSILYYIDITMFSSKLKNGMNQRIRQSAFNALLSMRNPIYIFFRLELANHWQIRTDNNPFEHEKVLSERNEAT